MKLCKVCFMDYFSCILTVLKPSFEFSPGHPGDQIFLFESGVLHS